MATHSSILAWRIPWTEERGKLQISSQTESLTIRIKNQFSPNMTLLHKYFSRDLFLNAQASIVFLTPQKRGKKKGRAAQNQDSVIGSLGFQLACIRQMSGQVSRGSAGEYQADERTGVARLSWRESGR